MTLSFVGNFDTIMSKLEAEVELAQIREKLERMKDSAGSQHVSV